MCYIPSRHAAKGFGSSCGNNCPHVSKKVSDATAKGEIAAGSTCYVSLKASTEGEAPASTPASWRALSACDATMVATPVTKGRDWTLLVKKDATDASPVWQYVNRYDDYMIT